jgi:hypothetical protein
MNHRLIAAVVGFALGLGLGCKPIDADKGIFSCATAADCGSGYECRPRFDSMTGRCFVAGFCKDEELCNGLDDNCDGRTDETFPTKGSACTTGQAGVCAPGKRVCTLGAEVCQADTMPTAETCNRLDDDCDGQTDETFDLMTDSANCGLCGKACAQGTLCRGGGCVESACGDGLDNDQNGKIDCLDEVCFGSDCEMVQAPFSRCGFAPFVPDAGDLDGGADAGLDPDAGLVDGGVDAGFVRGCFKPESRCDDGLDNDGDGVADCADPDCDNRACYTGQACVARQCPGPG